MEALSIENAMFGKEAVTTLGEIARLVISQKAYLGSGYSACPSKVIELIIRGAPMPVFVAKQDPAGLCLLDQRGCMASLCRYIAGEFALVSAYRELSGKRFAELDPGIAHDLESVPVKYVVIEQWRVNKEDICNFVNLI